MFESFKASTFAQMQDLLPSIGQVVTIEKCLYYLSLIEQISNLRNLFVDHLHALHARAELRYEYWVEGCKTSLPGPLVAPPIDVAYIMHAHLVSPFRYYEDCMRLNLPMLPLPLEQVHTQRDQPNDESLQFWKLCAPHEPFLLTLDNVVGDIVLKTCCHNCESKLSISGSDYGAWRFHATAYIKCWNCNIEYNMHHKAMVHLMSDIRDKKNYVRGTMISPSGKLQQESVIPSNYEFIHARKYFEGCYSGVGTGKELQRQTFHFAPTLPSSIYNVKSNKISTQSIEDFLGQHLKAADANKKLMQTFRCTYGDTNPSSFSLDLLQAIERQHVVGSRMLNVNWVFPDSVVRGLRNYKNFLLLMKDDRDLIGVPTLEIDVSWHTHQLHPVDYRRFTLQYIGRVINHDDTIPQIKLDIYSQRTRMAWEKKFDLFRRRSNRKVQDFGKDYVHGLLELEERVYDCCCQHHHQSATSNAIDSPENDKNKQNRIIKQQPKSILITRKPPLL
ncbi:hypothetical protein BC941DRAFT_441173 [Chlamydoabsidia padenii]|nr:hypothetical protein BC941DRAFT_441173 [Chlamydoabsidia padenii]